jgi:pimeloyl-ACP methyl ester carboxylesterase
LSTVIGQKFEFHSGEVRLAADVYGAEDGPPVVLLHGGGQTRHAWGTTAQVLAQRGWRAFTVDLRGHGESDWPEDGDYSSDAFAADVAAVAHSLPRPPALVGASLGGIASMLALGAEPDLASALVLVDVAPRIEPDGAARIGQFMLTNVDGFASLEEVADAVAAYNPHRPRPSSLEGLHKNVRQREDGRWVWHWDPRFLQGRRALVNDGTPDETRALHRREALEAAARSLTLPVLLVRGKVSDLLSEQGAQEMLEMVPHAKMVNVAGAGHMVAGDRNDLFNDAVVDFLEQVRPR